MLKVAAYTSGRNIPSARFRVRQYIPLLRTLDVEVVEHCVSPKTFAACAAGLLRPGGLLVLTTPYHGYLKNLAIALTGRWDSHHDPLWEGGHVKFFSPATITRLLAGAGFAVQSIERVGRVQVLAKSMVVTAVAP